MHALVTGAGGFIGRRLVASLRAKGYAVRGLFLPDEDASAAERDGVEVVRGDLIDPTTLGGVADGITHVFHLAARVADWGPLAAFRAVTVDGTGHLLEASRDKGVRRFVYFSSFTALGFSRDTVGFDEDAPCVMTGIPYSDTKVEAERLLAECGPRYGIPFTIIRPANVIGAGSLWARDVLDAFYRGPVPIIGDGTAPGAFVHVQNLVDGVILAAESDAAAGRTYHFIDDYPVTWAEYVTTLAGWIGRRPRGRLSTNLAWKLGAVADRICTPLGVRPPVSRIAAGIMGRNHMVSSRRAREELGWTPQVTYPEALADIREWVEAGYRPPSVKGQRDYRNYNVFITGGSTGIGLELAREYASRGAHVALFARDPVKLDAARNDIEGVRRAPHQRVATFSMDVGDEASVRARTAEAVAQLGAPDILINSAGIIANDRLENLPADTIESILRINVLGTFHVTRALLPSLKARRGRIVNLSSLAGLMGTYGYTAYGASKYAVVGLSESLRCELKPDGVDVTVVCPPEVNTAMVKAEEPTKSAESRALKESAGVLEPDAVARTIVTGVARRRFMIIPGARARLVYVVHALSLGWLTRRSSDLIVRRVRRGR